MKCVYERKINYYETDKMGVVHHSNYIRFLEETRCIWLEEMEMPFQSFEEKGVTIPVLEVHCKHKYHVTFGDTIIVKPFIKEYTGVRMTVGYEVFDKATGKLVLTGETKHCFTNNELRPINLKKVIPEFSDKFQILLDEYLNSKNNKVKGE